MTIAQGMLVSTVDDTEPGDAYRDVMRERGSIG
jgi:hypothetical protein